MKTCFKCQSPLPLSEFYKHAQMADGHLNKCKTCTKKDAAGARENRLEYYQAYDRVRGRTDHRKDRVKENAHKYVEGRQAWDGRNPEKKKAHGMVSKALKSGKLIKQPCFKCNTDKSVQAHHEDYSKPLDVIWLCPACHSKLHVEKERINGQESDLEKLARELTFKKTKNILTALAE